MHTADRILELLYDARGGWLAPEELARRAGPGGGGAELPAGRVTRAIAALRERGQRIESSPAHGLRLVRPARLDAHLIERDLRVNRVGRNVICFDQVDSTNDVVLASAAQSGSDGLAVLAESQRKGRGRLGRRWSSPAGANILMSILLKDPRGVLAHDALTIASGVATAGAVESVCALRCELKWPNDVLIDGAKTAGVLVELHGAGRRASAASGRNIVIGIGVNVNAAPPAGEVDRPATCLADELGHSVERIEVARAMLRGLDQWIEKIARSDLRGLHKAWMDRCGMINRRMAILSEGVRHVGRVIDVSPLEGLALCRDDGSTVWLKACESSVVD
ncbi:MAG: biotin--[acetyl-CoA-carboxylase] ligase [Phycisphaerae bacterium]